jgi:chromosome segregation ATPase
MDLLNKVSLAESALNDFLVEFTKEKIQHEKELSDVKTACLTLSKSFDEKSNVYTKKIKKQEEDIEILKNKNEKLERLAVITKKYKDELDELRKSSCAERDYQKNELKEKTIELKEMRNRSACLYVETQANQEEINRLTTKHDRLATEINRLTVEHERLVAITKKYKDELDHQNIRNDLAEKQASEEAKQECQNALRHELQRQIYRNDELNEEFVSYKNTKQDEISFLHSFIRENSLNLKFTIANKKRKFI